MFLPSEVAFPYFVYSAIVTDRVMAYKNKNHNNSYVYTEFRQKPLFTLTLSFSCQPDPQKTGSKKVLRTKNSVYKHGISGLIVSNLHDDTALCSEVRLRFVHTDRKANAIPSE